MIPPSDEKKEKTPKAQHSKLVLWFECQQLAIIILVDTVSHLVQIDYTIIETQSGSLKVNNINATCSWSTNKHSKTFPFESFHVKRSNLMEVPDLPGLVIFLSPTATRCGRGGTEVPDPNPLSISKMPTGPWSKLEMVPAWLRDRFRWNDSFAWYNPRVKAVYQHSLNCYTWPQSVNGITSCRIFRTGRCLQNVNRKFVQ